MASIDTLIDDLNSVITGGNPGGLSNEHQNSIVAKYGIIAERQWRESFLKPDQKRRLRMSNWGKKCNREGWYEEHPHGRKIEKLEPRLLNMFSYGHLVEHQMLMLCELAGHDVKFAQQNVELVDGISGHLDVILDGMVCDVKSASDYAFQKFQNGYNKSEDMFGYWAQLNGYYAACCRNPDIGKHVTVLDRVGWLACNKTTGEFCLDMHRPDAPRFTRANANSKVNICKADEAPPRLPDVEQGANGNRKLDTACAYCQWKFECWPDVRVFEYKKGNGTYKQYLTKVGKEPNVREINKEVLYDETTSEKEQAEEK